MQVLRHVYYRGRVQGVGFRFAVLRAARGRDVTGFVRNLWDGRVEMVVEGEENEVADLMSEVDRIMAGYIHHAEVLEEPPRGRHTDFRIAFDGG